MSSALAALRVDVAADAAVFLRRLDQAVELPATTGDGPDLAYTAIALQHAYSALESLLERCIRHFDGALPTGHDSHRELLQRAGRAVPGVRPALLSPESVAAARTFLRFRHFIRHDYGTDLDPELLALIQNGIRGSRPAFALDLQGVDAWLATVAAVSAD